MSCVELVRITKKAKNNLAEAEIWFRGSWTQGQINDMLSLDGTQYSLPTRLSPETLAESMVKAAVALHKARNHYTLTLQN